ncbi:tetraacyldisaccharide 4'-kinase [Maribacter sp. 2307ULW6-5]|uniref:tetraacyldisaccharide 4'-kinase n=1 Tax=Maribacter sp. 2307ULW6-5 TaxID=3386275 RepID=UPI0039BD7678
MGPMRKLLFPVSLVYALVVRIRNLLYDVGLFRSTSFEVPTLCVGNLSVGGTGKTPMVELLLRELGKERKLAVLSRGYKRRSKGFFLAGTDATVAQLGDEPYQLKNKFPGVQVAVDADRRNGILRLGQTVAPDLIILDDAFQHRRVRPSFSILLTTHDSLYVDDWYLPTGDLRDSKRAADRADVIVVTKCPEDLGERAAKAIREKLRPKPHQTVLFAKLAYGTDFWGAHGPVGKETVAKGRFTLVTGIAKPAPLVRYLRGQGHDFEHLAYPDHHFFTEKQLDVLRSKPLVVTTEKDFMRLGKQVPHAIYLPVEHAFLWNGRKALLDKLATSGI